MSQRPHPLAIGAFFAVAITLLVATLLFFGGSGLFRQEERFVLFFDGTITGLKVGAPVTFQGVQVGQVASIELGMDTDNGNITIPVYIDIDRRKFGQFADSTDVLVKRGLRAQLKIQSLLTSLLYIELDFHPGYAARFVSRDSDYKELPTIPTPFQEWSKHIDEMNVTQLMQKTRMTIDGIEKLVNSPEMQQSAAALHRLLVHADEAVVKFDQQLLPAVDDLRKTLRSIDHASANIGKAAPALQDELQATLRDARAALARFDAAMTQAGFVFSEDSPLYQEIVEAARDVSDAARSVERTSDTLDRQPEALLRGKQSPTAEK